MRAEAGKVRWRNSNGLQRPTRLDKGMAETLELFLGRASKSPESLLRHYEVAVSFAGNESWLIEKLDILGRHESFGGVPAVKIQVSFSLRNDCPSGLLAVLPRKFTSFHEFQVDHRRKPNQVSDDEATAATKFALGDLILYLEDARREQRTFRIVVVEGQTHEHRTFNAFEG